MNRWPTLTVLALLIAGLVALDQRGGDTSDAFDGAVAPDPAVAATVEHGGSTWYCPAGFATPDGLNDHVIIITNRSDDSVDGTLTLYPTLLDTLGESRAFARAVQPVEIAPQSQQRIELSAAVSTLDEQLARTTGAFVGALAELGGGDVGVEHAVVTPAGADVEACATTASSTWWFASGTTTADVRYQLYLLNPFADDAVVDVTFVTDGGVRSPSEFRGRLVPAQTLTVLDVSPIVPVWEQMTAEITTRTGRVIAERIQIFGSAEGPSGVSLAFGAPRRSEQWFFPAGRALDAGGESYMVFNPGELPAEVEFEIKPDSVDRLGDVAPLPVTLGPRERWIVNVSTHASHPVNALATLDASDRVGLDERFFVTVRSFNGVPIVAERLLTRSQDVGPGVSASLGIVTASTDQYIALEVLQTADVDESTGEDIADPAVEADRTLAILNPAGDTIARVQVLLGGPRGESVRAEVELAPRRRAVFDLESLGVVDEQWIRVVSSTGTMVELIGESAGAVSSATAIAAEDSTSVPDLYAFE